MSFSRVNIWKIAIVPKSGICEHHQRSIVFYMHIDRAPLDDVLEQCSIIYIVDKLYKLIATMKNNNYYHFKVIPEQWGVAFDGEKNSVAVMGRNFFILKALYALKQFDFVEIK